MSDVINRVPCPTCLHVLKEPDDPLCSICVNPDFRFYEPDENEINRRTKLKSKQEDGE